MSDSERTRAETSLIEPSVATLLAESGRSAKFTLEPLKGGRNNRTYRVRTSDCDSLLKWYFTHHRDNRDRLGTEFAFCRCLWRHGLRQIPQPLGADHSAGLGLYEFLSGRTLTSGDVTLAHHDQAVTFLRDINALRTEPDALSLGKASEACFSLAAHVQRVDERLRRLADIVIDDEGDREMIELIRSKLQPAFEQHREELTHWAVREKLDFSADLQLDDRLLSPSDFGFHNALLREDGGLRFIDFEYAGWDDPAKLACDFFCQIEVPALASGFEDFLERVARLVANPEAAVQRALRLLPLYQIKWCCIVLNDFLPTGSARRSFNEPHQADTRRLEQLATARRLFDRVGRVPGTDC